VSVCLSGFDPVASTTSSHVAAAAAAADDDDYDDTRLETVYRDVRGTTHFYPYATTIVTVTVGEAYFIESMQAK